MAPLSRAAGGCFGWLGLGSWGVPCREGALGCSPAFLIQLLSVRRSSCPLGSHAWILIAMFHLAMDLASCQPPASDLPWLVPPASLASSSPGTGGLVGSLPAVSRLRQPVRLLRLQHPLRKAREEVEASRCPWRARTEEGDLWQGGGGGGGLCSPLPGIPLGSRPHSLSFLFSAGLAVHQIITITVSLIMVIAALITTLVLKNCCAQSGRPRRNSHQRKLDQQEESCQNLTDFAPARVPSTLDIFTAYNETLQCSHECVRTPVPVYAEEALRSPGDYKTTFNGNRPSSSDRHLIPVAFVSEKWFEISC
ncbi:PREDICTED: adherens junction-associated protein 1 [Pygoscelis adeliae]|uniref:adherens junction-associated protein 1 n=1 Tax=Pygoscelis adeliae TaxID=9238 RepID=UPI0004F508EA|nr:PREDICTED: adherens junction-associated protein 1 [Pygoscelis adeliae]